MARRYVIKVEGLYIASLIGGPRLDMTYSATQGEALKLTRELKGWTEEEAVTKPVKRKVRRG